MRHRRAKALKERDIERGRQQYAFQTTSDSNGPVGFLDVNRKTIGQVPLISRLKVTKPYTSALANGYAVSDGNDSNITNSELLYRLFEENPDIMNTVHSEFTDQSAINHVLKKSQSYGDILLLVSAVEARKTAGMLKSVFINLYKFIFGIYKAIKHLDAKEAYLILSDAWLQYRYGWTPLYLELDALYKNFTDGNIFSIRSSYGGAKHENTALHFDRRLDFLVEDFKYDSELHLEIREVVYRLGFNYFNSSTSRNADSLARLGLDLKSLLSTAWELIPFSFILDMFVNVGDSLTALDVKAEVNPINGYKTSVLQCIVSVKEKSALLSTEDVRYTLHNKFAQVGKFVESHNHYGFATGREFSYDYNTSGVERTKFAYFTAVLFTQRDMDDPDSWLRRRLHKIGYPSDIDSSMESHYYETDGRSRGGWSNLSCGYWEERHYEGNKAYISAQVVPQNVLNMFCEKVASPSLEVLQSILDEFIAEFGSIIRVKKFIAYVNDRGYSTHGFRFTSGGKFEDEPRIWHLRKSYVQDGFDNFLDEHLYRIYPLRGNPSELIEDPTIPAHGFLGEFTQRVDHNHFDFKMVADMDLSKSQVADLIIFGERLLTAIRKKLK